jgi:hypothetical protein
MPASAKTKYTLGTHDPVINFDPGAGTWNSKPKTINMQALKLDILNRLPRAFVVIGDDAAKHMYHFFKNSGNKYTIDLQDMIDDLQDAKNRYEEEIDNAKKFIQRLPAGTHHITTDTAARYYNDIPRNWNWFYAVSGYSAWIKGVATVTLGKNGESWYRLDYEYKVADRYTWDNGKRVKISGVTITDQFMGEFHRQGLAREFKMEGSIKTVIEWDSLNPIHTVLPSPSGR